MTPGADTILIIEPHCEHCPYKPGVPVTDKPWSLGYLVEMKPGPDGRPWHLCAKCWLDGLMQQSAAAEAPSDNGRVVEVLAGTEGDPRCESKKKTRRNRRAQA